MSSLPLLQPGRHPRGVLGQLRMTFRHRDNFNGDFCLWVVWSGEAFCLCSKLGFLISLVEKNTGTHRDGRKCTCWGGSLAGCLAHSSPSSSIPSMLSFPALLVCCAHWCLDRDMGLGLVLMWENLPSMAFLFFYLLLTLAEELIFFSTRKIYLTSWCKLSFLHATEFFSFCWKFLMRERMFPQR